MEETVWIMGKYTAGKDWEVQGVFASEEDALANVKFRSEFIGPVPFGKRLPDDRVTWPGSYYPLAEEPAQAGARRDADTTL